MKKHLLILFAALLPLVASAQTQVEIDGIWYNLIKKVKTAEVTYKGEYAHSYDEYSGSITIPATVTYGGVTYSVTSIGDDAFCNCNLTAITIPESVTSIGDDAFSCCSNLTTINIPKGVTSIANSAFEGCSSLTSITLPKGVTSIGERAFYECSS
ncbi:MAG: leucine-rich repeat domain-containing protein, partial [Bacteroidaceae bacterium]|nr:leucine-rich repeat domain-containing protein [Bacteroidaceae bacterium]